jgi:hypothetical protein
VQDGEGGVNDANVEFYELVSAVLDEGLDSLDVFGILFNAGIIGQEEEFRVGYSSQ